jgi:hypothetical protein
MFYLNAKEEMKVTKIFQGHQDLSRRNHVADQRVTPSLPPAMSWQQ